MNNASQQGSKQSRSQSELETIIRQGKFNSQSDANSYLQQHGLSCQMKDDGTAEIIDTSNGSQKVATVQFQQQGSQSGSSGSQQREISSISY